MRIMKDNVGKMATNFETIKTQTVQQKRKNEEVTKKTKLRKRKVNTRLSTKILKSNYEKALMQAMLQLAKKKQRRMKETIIKMDFELNPNLKLPHQLMLKNQLNHKNLPSEDLIHPQAITITTLNQHHLSDPSASVNPLVSPYPYAFPASSNSLNIAPFIELPSRLLFPSPVDGEVEPSGERLQMHPLDMIVVNPTGVVGIVGIILEILLEPE